MDRFRWCSDTVGSSGFSKHSGVIEESLVIQQYGVRLYDGSERSGFDNGTVTLTTHRLFWSARPNHTSEAFLALPLAAIIDIRSEDGGGIVRNRTPKLVLRLLSVTALANMLASLPLQLPWMDRWSDKGSLHAVVSASPENHIKLGFTRAGEKEFGRALDEVLQAKVWTIPAGPTSAATSRSLGGSVGIGAIQRQQAARAGHTDMKLEEAFRDLNNLMSSAMEMVTLSRTLASRARETKGGQLTTDETVELRAAMLAIGLDHQNASVSSSDAHGKSHHQAFHVRLAHQISALLTPLLQVKADSNAALRHHTGAGCVDLASAYCRVNRARGVELVSPEDLVRACELLEQENLPLRLKSFPSGLLVLQLASENESDTLDATVTLVQEHGSLTADELARVTALPTLLTRERLLAVEEQGRVCRDDSVAGLRFYPNLFLSRDQQTA